MKKKYKIAVIIVITNILTALLVISISAKINVGRYMKNTKLFHESAIDIDKARKKIAKTDLPTSLLRKKKITRQKLSVASKSMKQLREAYVRFIKRQKAKQKR